MSKYSTIFDIALAQQWAIVPGWIDTVLAIAGGLGEPEKYQSRQALRGQQDQALDEDNRISYRDGIAIVSLRGPIFPRANLMTEFSGAASAQRMAYDLRELANSSKVDGIMLEVDSPGGVVTGISQLSQLVREIGQEKPIWSYVDGMACSAAYWITSATNKILLADTSEVGSIGVIQAHYKRDDDTLVFVSAKSPKKRVNPETEEGKAEIEKTLNAIYDVFAGEVAKNRSVSQEYVEESFGQGGVFVGTHALPNRMADGVDTFEGAMAKFSEHLSDSRRGIYSMSTIQKGKLASAIETALQACGIRASDEEEKVVEETKAATTAEPEPQVKELAAEVQPLAVGTLSVTQVPSYVKKIFEGQAKEFSMAQVKSGKLLPAQASGLEKLFVTLALDDAQAEEIEGSNFSRVDALKAMFEGVKDTHSNLTRETLEDTELDVAVLPNGGGSKSGSVSPERKAELMKYSMFDGVKSPANGKD